MEQLELTGSSKALQRLVNDIRAAARRAERQGQSLGAGISEVHWGHGSVRLELSGEQATVLAERLQDLARERGLTAARGSGAERSQPGRPPYLYIGTCQAVRERYGEGEALWEAMMDSRELIDWREFGASCETSAILADGETLEAFAFDNPDANCYRSDWHGGAVMFIQRAGFEFIFADEATRTRLGVKERPTAGELPRWDGRASAAAARQGWNLFEVSASGPCPVELQRDDEAGVFAHDAEAHAHVMARAAAGDWVARQALAYLRLHAPAAYEAVRRAGAAGESSPEP